MTRSSDDRLEAGQPTTDQVLPISYPDASDGTAIWRWPTRWFAIAATSGAVAGVWCSPGVVWTVIVGVGFGLVCSLATLRWSGGRSAERAAMAVLAVTAGAIVGCGLATGEWRRMAVAGISALIVAGPWVTSKLLLQRTLIDDDVMVVAAAGLLFGLFGVEMAGWLLAALVVVRWLGSWWSTVGPQSSITFATIVVNAMLLAFIGVAVVERRDLSMLLSG